MQKIHLDFRNRYICIQTEEQLTIEPMKDSITKEYVRKYVVEREKYIKYDNFTMDFETNRLSFNKSVILVGKMDYEISFINAVEDMEVSGLDEEYEKVVGDLGFCLLYKSKGFIV